MERDAVDLIVEQWARARPDLDASPMRVLGRLSRATRLIDRAVAAHIENERRILAALDEDQQDALAATLRTLLLSLGDEADAPRAPGDL